MATMKMTYVVTGTSRGIGLELSKQIVGQGHALHALARSPAESRGLLALKEKYPELLRTHAVDVTSPQAIRAFSQELADIPVDVLINNAGVYTENDDDFQNLPFENVEKTFATNTFGPMRMTQALLRNLKKSRDPKVIHITSQMGSITDNTSGGSYSYRMSKAALNMFEKSFSIDFPEILSAVIHPGWVQTEMGGKNAPTASTESAAGILQLISRLKKQESGKFFDYEGDPLPW